MYSLIGIVTNMSNNKSPDINRYRKIIKQKRKMHFHITGDGLVYMENMRKKRNCRKFRDSTELSKKYLDKLWRRVATLNNTPHVISQSLSYQWFAANLNKI